jgi:hypothetical protein
MKFLVDLDESCVATLGSYMLRMRLVNLDTGFTSLWVRMSAQYPIVHGKNATDGLGLSWSRELSIAR